MKMRITLLLIQIFLFTAVIVHAQIGIRAGVNLATMNFEGGDAEFIESENTANLPGLNIGLTLEFPLSQRFSLQPEIHFIQKGMTGESSASDPIQTESTFRLNYAEFALMAKVNILNFGETGGLYVGLTPHFGYALSGELKYEFNDQSSSFPIIFDDFEISRIDYGFGLGFGISFGNAYLDGRYNLGLANLEKDDESDVKFYNRGILIGLGYRF